MSKSVIGSAIFITDSLNEIKSKLAKVPTDSGKGTVIPKQGGVANLLQLVELFLGKDKKERYAKAYTKEGVRYGDLKAELAEAIYADLKPIQDRRAEIKSVEVEKIILEGAEKARKIAGNTLQEVKTKMGLI